MLKTFLILMISYYFVFILLHETTGERARVNVAFHSETRYAHRLQRRSDFRSRAHLREKVRKDGSVARSLGQCSVNLNSQLSDFRAF